MMLSLKDKTLMEGLESCALPNESFHHRDHVHVAWAYLQLYPLQPAFARFSTALRAFAASHGKTSLYHETVTYAYMALINERLDNSRQLTWTEFADANPDLLQWNKLTMKLINFAIAFTLLQDPYKVAPNNYRLEFENQYTRVSRASLKPGDKIPVHDHPAAPTVYVYLTDAGPVQFSHVTPRFSIERAPVKAGAIRINQANPETHEVEYFGTTPSEYLRIEMKGEFEKLPSRTVRLTPEDSGPFQNKNIRIRRASCAAGEKCLAEFPTVVVSIDERSARWVQPKESVAMGAGGTHPLIFIEFKTSLD